MAAGAQVIWPGSYNKHHVQKHLEEFDAWHFFNACGGLIETGATQTNVMDLLILILH
jgi:glycerate-2-kinase